ncbi:MAG: hypothetical protein K0A93_09035 [Desulfuromonadaceae bacterium]|nr:hypothetical protein [Desulfuromonadaceae bacterium]
MKPKLVSTLIIIVVATGTAIIPFAGGASIGTEPLRSIFFAFVSAIIAIQLVPVIMLLGCVIKSAFLGNENKEEN